MSWAIPTEQNSTTALKTITNLPGSERDAEPDAPDEADPEADPDEADE